VFRRLFRNVVRGFVGLRQKSQIFVGVFSLVQHDPKGSHYKVLNQGRGILHEIMRLTIIPVIKKKGSDGSGWI